MGVKAKVTRITLGKHWDAKTKKWEDKRTNVDQLGVPQIPDFIKTLHQRAIEKANKLMKLDAQYPYKACDIAIINYYGSAGRLNMHQDQSESWQSIKEGHPVVAFSVGDTCDLEFANERPAAGQKPKSTQVESGDAYLFGGKSRMMFHGINNVKN